jgi:hypothetical protein
VKSLIHKIFRTDFVIKLRNTIGFRPLYMSAAIDKKFNYTSISDAFPWRTDNGYKTTFKYSDILGLFYKIEDSYVELVFYSRDNDIVKKIIINQLNYSNELLIDKDFLNGIEGYGVFYIFHRSDSYCGDYLAISNRCYVGFSIKDSLSSFVHGNCLVRFQTFDGKYDGSDMVKSSFTKKPYRIQNSFEEFTKSELFFVNPTSKKINFSIGNNNYILENNCSIIIDVSRKENVLFFSKCMFLRPIIFNYKDGFYDVYHA